MPLVAAIRADSDNWTLARAAFDVEKYNNKERIKAAPNVRCLNLASS